MQEMTKEMIVRIAHADPTATDAELERIERALVGGRRSSVVSIGDAARRLGRHRNTVVNLVRAGRLVGVRGSGSRNIGVTEASIEALENETNKENKR